MITKVTPETIIILAELAHKLWPEESIDDLAADFSDTLNDDYEDSFLYKDDDGIAVGFIQLSIRSDYVEGSESSPVAYIEGIFVEEDARRSGIAQELVKFAESWGKRKGCTEIASDCELDNVLSIDFHKGIGFQEANRLVCFIKSID